jgi:hypothetical protein
VNNKYIILLSHFVSWKIPEEKGGRFLQNKVSPFFHLDFLWIIFKKDNKIFLNPMLQVAISVKGAVEIYSIAPPHLVKWVFCFVWVLFKTI